MRFCTSVGDNVAYLRTRLSRWVALLCMLGVMAWNISILCGAYKDCI